MNEQALESFIQSCDDMMIATEENLNSKENIAALGAIVAIVYGIRLYKKIKRKKEEKMKSQKLLTERINNAMSVEDFISKIKPEVEKEAKYIKANFKKLFVSEWNSIKHKYAHTENFLKYASFASDGMLHYDVVKALSDISQYDFPNGRIESLLYEMMNDINKKINLKYLTVDSHIDPEDDEMDCTYVEISLPMDVTDGTKILTYAEMCNLLS